MQEAVGFGLGFFATVLPKVAVVVGVVAVVSGLATPIEALIMLALVLLLLATMFTDKSHHGTFAHRAIVYAIAEAMVWLALVPRLGSLAEPLGTFVVLWLPIVVLAVVAWLI
jgi:hypothetical protein